MKFNVCLLNLSCLSYETISVNDDVLRKYIGGSGLGTYFFMKYSKIGVDPLSPENPLVYMTGPFQGTGVPTSGRHHIVTKSPLTDCYGESDCGGTFGFNMLRSGFYGFIIIGKSEKPIYILIDDRDVSFIDASVVWGKDTYETDEILTDIHGKCTVSCIGPSGEMQNLLACIAHDGKHARMAGRSGLGAVMGSKNLKAVIVKGTSEANIFDPFKVKELNKAKALMFREKLAGMTRMGTASGMIFSEKIGDLPIKNWTEGSFSEGIEYISGEAQTETILKGDYGCFACPIRCGREIQFDELGEEIVAGLEYESIGMLGSNCLISDLKKVAIACDICNRMGVDSISCGAAVSFAMELYEKGILSKDSIGFELKWGDGNAMIKLVKMITEQSGIGKILSLGTKKASALIGDGTSKYSISSKGLDFPAHDPRCYASMAVGYATANRGASHMDSMTWPLERNAAYSDFGQTAVLDRNSDEGKGKLQVLAQNLLVIIDSLKMCKFPLYSCVAYQDLLDWLNGITGWGVDKEEMLKSGERIFNLKRIYNISLGMNRKDDTLPERILKEPRGSGGSAEFLPNLQMQLDEYYKERGWTQNGIPTIEKIKELGLEEFEDWYSIYLEK